MPRVEATQRPGHLGALLLADARLPTGGHAYSSGLEPALLAGVEAADVPAYLQVRLHTVGLVEAAAAVLSRRATLAGDAAELIDVHEALLARTPSAPLREASFRLGRGLERLVRRLGGSRPEAALLAAVGPEPQRAIALGALAAVLGMDAAQTARASLYDDVQSVASAALKLLPVDPADVTGWVLDTEPVLEEITAQAEQVTEAHSLPACTAPLIEQWSLDHATRTRRIFIA